MTFRLAPWYESAWIGPVAASNCKKKRTDVQDAFGGDSDNNAHRPFEVPKYCICLVLLFGSEIPGKREGYDLGRSSKALMKPTLLFLFHYFPLSQLITTSWAYDWIKESDGLSFINSSSYACICCANANNANLTLLLVASCGNLRPVAGTGWCQLNWSFEQVFIKNVSDLPSELQQRFTFVEVDALDWERGKTKNGCASGSATPHECRWVKCQFRAVLNIEYCRKYMHQHLARTVDE